MHIMTMQPIHLPAIASSATPPAAAPITTLLEVLLLSAGGGCFVLLSVLGVDGSTLAGTNRIMDLQTVLLTTG